MRLGQRENTESGMVWWEVLLIVAVVAGLAVLGVFGLRKGKQHSRDSACMTNLKLIGNAMAVYT